MECDSPVLAELRAPDRLMPLGPGEPNEGVASRFRGLTMETLFAPALVKRPDFAQACLAGLWLWHDFLDESHRISQELTTVEGSYWHAIMHRREPDYWNSKYWFRRVGVHAVFEPLAESARAEARDGPHAARFLTDQRSWDPFAFVDLCETAARAGGELESFCRRVQRTEWELLFEFCWRRALGQS